MVLDPNDVRTLITRIVETLEPQRVVLFGSHARGDAAPRSDVDILVVADSDRTRYERAIPIYRAIADLPVEVDVMVYTPAEVRDWSRVDQAFVTTALREGR
ncbi:MAG: nucleotidyltransferase domain-containing protein, partial [Planctomycetota bacterium]